jgi:hypothetical protein
MIAESYTKMKVWSLYEKKNETKFKKMKEQQY